ncbi:MAG: filamentous hemagglutinin family protein [Alphaproteobacteria bacterium]|nr:filamentous hemagglutinin family protein [Alphaproteobacteria bacterium]
MGNSQRHRTDARIRRHLLKGASVLALAAGMSVQVSQAGSNSQLAVLRGVNNIARTVIAQRAPLPAQGGGTIGQNAKTAAGMASARLRALQYGARVSTAVDMADQAQEAAREAAAALQTNVPDGLGEGGLDPVDDPVSAANDTTGVHTWDGADQPTQTKTGDGVDVTIHQTQARAILSWETFNVGKNTTLTFDQSQNGQAQPGWVALNRVVGQLDPNTGLRNPNDVPAPSQILGTIKAPGTVLIINQNGIVFGGKSQINVESLIATSLEIGRSYDPTGKLPLNIKDRNLEFQAFGLLGFAEQASDQDQATAYTFSSQQYLDPGTGQLVTDPLLEGMINVNAGAQIATEEGGFIFMGAPKIVNSGTLYSPLGEVALQAGRDIRLIGSTGASGSDNPDVRGFVAQTVDSTPGEYVINSPNAIIDVPQGYLSLGTTQFGAIIQDGLLESTTSVSRNGFIQLTGGDIQIGTGSTMAITPEDGGTIPQDPVSLEDFKLSRISIGSDSSRIEIQQNAMLFAPAANMDIGSASGASSTDDSSSQGKSRVFIDNGAIIDVAGLTDVIIPAFRNSIRISPVKGNELANDPNYRNSWLNGATVFVDPRLSGVRADGTAWIGSPLIDAASYAQQVGISVKELMTKGGNVTLGVRSHAAGSDAKNAPDIIVKSGATIDISGGWVQFEAGFVQTTQLITASGQIVDISVADPNGDYVGIYTGYTLDQPRWGMSQSWASPLLLGARYETGYSEGHDAGSLTLKGSSIVLDGSVYGEAFAGQRQIADARIGTGTSSIFGDNRALQGAPSQLPSGGLLFVQALAENQGSTVNLTGGGDISIVGEANYHPVSSDLAFGQSVYVDEFGNLVTPQRDEASYLPLDRQQTISLSSDALSGMGLSEVSLQTSGKIHVESDATLNLSPGGVFNGLAGRTITIDGNITVPSGTIRLQTINAGVGSVFMPDDQPQLGSYDIVVNGTLSTRGLWINNFGADADHMSGDVYTDGGSITLIAAPRQLLGQDRANTGDPDAPKENVDISGSILLNQGSLIDVSGGGYVRPIGTFDLSARGGDLSLIEETTYFQLADDPNYSPGTLPGFRVNGIDFQGNDIVAVNPSQINARVSLDGTILAAGFAGGGTFNLVTPQIAFGDGQAEVGTELPLDFFSRSGFSNYNITSYKTDLQQNTFTNGLEGYNALLATQTLTIGSGQTLLLSESLFSPVLDSGQIQSLRGLGTGGDLYSVMTPAIPTDAWDAHPINLSLGGLIELDVAQGGSIIGEAGATLAVSKLYNAGLIHIPGGAIIQSEVLPSLYNDPATTLAIRSLSDAFTVNADGTIDEGAPNALGILGSDGNPLTNAQLAATYSFYFLGAKLGATDGIVLAAGSTTDLSGTSILDPRATAFTQDAGHIRTGRIISGGIIETRTAKLTDDALFTTALGTSVYNSTNPVGQIGVDYLTADPGAVIDISGTADVFELPSYSGRLTPTEVWSDGGTIAMGNGGTLTGATIHAEGGGAHGMGGTLITLDPTLSQNDPEQPTRDAISAELIEKAGFDTLVAEGSLSSVGDVTLKLGRGFFLVSRPYDGLLDLNNTQQRDELAPVISAGGYLEIDAPYIRFDSVLQNVSTPYQGDLGGNTVVFKADEIDISGAVLFDQSIAEVQLNATGDIRLSGVRPWQQIFDLNPQSVQNSLVGQLAVNGNLEITAGQVYPTTGSKFYVTSSNADGTITFERSGTETPPVPYSAGGNLTIQAANIVQGGVIRVPIGTLTLGGDDPFTITTDGIATQFAPATESTVATEGSITSVSAEGLVIPYGITTDQLEWFFGPTGSDELKAPPAATLNIGGTDVSLESGATVDVSGGGDLFAYEFISGIGGSKDVLDRFSTDPYTSLNGYQYPDGRQVYAIVPGLSNSIVAAYDPIYSAQYGDLYSPQNAGQQVYLQGIPGLAPGWYTLLPAKYAMLPGGMRIVENTRAVNLSMGRPGRLRDGSYVVSGYYGTAGTDSYQSTLTSFTVQSQNIFRKYSNIALTSANLKFAQDAAHNGQLPPRLPVDAGRLVLAPARTLEVETELEATPGEGGRGSQVDVSGTDFDIVSALPDVLQDGTIYLTADSLTNLNASSLLIGGVRTDNSDGTTSLDITAETILVNNDASHPLTGPEVILAVDGSGSSITLENGATIIASGKVDDPRSGDYLIDGSGDMSGQGAVLRVSTGPQRLVTRTNIDEDASVGRLDVGRADLEGISLLLESSGDLTASPDATIKAEQLALGASKVTFTSNGDGLSGLVITPELQALFGQANALTIRTPGSIDFSSGTYHFNNLTLDTPGLELIDGNSVVLDADTLTLANHEEAGAACDSEGAADCGGGALTIHASEIDFGSGTVRTYGFGGSVTLAGTSGIFAQGKKSVFDVGPATLNLQTPFLADRALAPVPGQPMLIPDLTLTTTGDVFITNPTNGKPGDIDGAPGSSISINGDSVSISGTTIRATAGLLHITADDDITVGDGAKLETPGYSHNFGDAADPYIVSAPGGLLQLTAVNGDIDLQAGSLLSVGGGRGSAGTLELQAAQGGVTFDGMLDASAPDKGGSFILDENDAFDLSTLGGIIGTEFNGMIAIRTATGDLVLANGQTLKAHNVVLTADGGLVDIAGTIDASGATGGIINLFGLDGVTLESESLLDAHATGYGIYSTRQARGGDVFVGTDGDGAIRVENGAAIDVSARNTRDRLVPVFRNGTVYYIYVPGDFGGTVHFRSSVIEQEDGDTVNVFYDGTIKGATNITLEGFKKFDLEQIAADPNFVGVTIDENGRVVLDVGAKGSDGQINWLADYGDGTLVQFVQDFDISAANGQLGSLIDSGVFHEAPGMELDYSGDIVLSSNWNLGAGIVNVAAAVRAGLMAELPTVDGKYYVLPGKEGEVFRRFTTLIYRTDGSVYGEPGILTIRAGGTLDIKGSITDGFFQFHDQNDPDYLNMALGGGDKIYSAFIRTGCFGSCAGILQWQMMAAPPGSYVSIAFPGSGSLSSILFNPAPYSAEANSPAALGSLDGNTGDPLGSAQLFPLLTRWNGDAVPVESWSYRLVGGADLASVDPLRVIPGADGNLIIEGEKKYTYFATKDGATSAFGDTLLLGLSTESGIQLLSADDWYNAFVAANPGLDANSYTFINLGLAPKDVQNFLINLANDFFAQYPDQFQIFQSKGAFGISTSLNLAAKFMAQAVAPDFSQFKGEYKPPKPPVITKPTTAYVRTLVRTGTGNIDLAAAGNIDLTNGPVVKRDQNGNGNCKGGDQCLQVGGTAVYTAGHLVDPSKQIITDALSGLTVALDPGGFVPTNDFIWDPMLNGYQYGAGGAPDSPGVGYSGILIANPVYLTDGGDISMQAGADILGRRDVWTSGLIGRYYNATNGFGYTWIGQGDQPWRTGRTGTAPNLRINPQLFTEGVGALGGGNIRIRAGRDISDLSIVDDTTVTTASAAFNSKPGSSLALVTFGGGDVDVEAGRDLLGGRLDVGSGFANIVIGGNVQSAGDIQTSFESDITQANGLRIRLTDGNIGLWARGDLQIQGITALGVTGATNDSTQNLDEHGFYSTSAGVSLIADGNVTIDNKGADVLTEKDSFTHDNATAVYPGSLTAVSLTGDLVLATGGTGVATSILLYPSPSGNLQLAAANNIAPTVIAMSDADPGLLPGFFSTFEAGLSGLVFGFPGILPDMSAIERRDLHNRRATHLGDAVPNRIYAGSDILDMIISVPKQTRIGAGRDIVNMMFFGQNLSGGDITRIAAGRDITATTKLVQPVIEDNPLVFGNPEAAVQGNTFVIAGPGSFFLEAGRDMGPFLNSAVTDGFELLVNGETGSTGKLVFAGGVLSVGNDWNPWLPAGGASLFVEFGVGKGQNFDGFRDYYLDPANLPNLDGDLFAQVTDANGNLVPDRNRPIYGPILIEWMQAHAAAKLREAYGTTDVDFQQAYDVFTTLPELEQRVFILGNVYFNELKQTSIPDGPSYKQYTRGYRAVNTLFPSSYGYTENDLTGGGNGSNQPVETGNLDLRLATIQTDHGGNIYLVGPGGRVLAGSTVRTADQAARRTYDGGRLFAGAPFDALYPATITAIPIGYEGILTLRGGSIFTFTDTDFLLNQSRLFTEGGGDIAMWSSNGDLNAGQGPKTSANFPPVVVRIDENLFIELDSVSGVSGAGIAAFEPGPGEPAPNVYLVAPRGTVDAGDAGVRVAGNLFIAAQTVANANNFTVGGSSFGVPGSSTVDVAAQTSASSASASAEQIAQSFAAAHGQQNAPSIISVDFLGMVDDSEELKRKRRRSTGS